MAVQVLSLGSGQLSNSVTALFSASATLTTIVKTIRLVNTDTATRTVNLYFQQSGQTQRRIAPVNLSLAPGVCYVDDQEITMSVNDQVLGSADVGSKVDFVVSGIQR